jgi:hypothetical protein
MLEKQRTLFKIKYHVQFKLLYMMLYMEKQLYIHKKHNTKSHGFFKDNDKYWNFSIITFFYGIMNVSRNNTFKIVQCPLNNCHSWMNTRFNPNMCQHQAPYKKHFFTFLLSFQLHKNKSNYGEDKIYTY